MKNIFSFSLFMFVSLAVFSQDSLAYKADKASNKFVYAENTVKIFAGQQISISLNNKKILKLIDKGESKITDMSKMTLNVLKQNGEKNIIVDYNILKQDDGTFMTFLIVNNPFEQPLSYKAKMFSKKTNTYVETNVLDIQPGISGVETWPYAIPNFGLYDFTVQK